MTSGTSSGLFLSVTKVDRDPGCSAWGFCGIFKNAGNALCRERKNMERRSRRNEKREQGKDKRAEGSRPLAGRKERKGKKTDAPRLPVEREQGKDRRAEGSRPLAGQEKEQKGKPKTAQKGREKNIACPVYKKCGGCQLLHMDYEKQLEWKKKQASALLKPYGKLKEVIAMEEPVHYRCKVHAVFGRDRNGKVISGIYKEGTHTVVPVKTCLLEDEKADAIIQTIKGLLRSFKIKTYDEDTGYGLLRHVLVRVGARTGQIMVVLVLSSPIMPSKNNFVKALRKEHPEITTVVVNVNDKITSMVLGDKEQVIYGPGYIEDELCGMTFKISPKSFYQVNPRQAEKLYKKAMEYAGLTGKETVLDAYCGTGTIGMLAAPKADKVIGVELNKDAVKDAVAGAKKNHLQNIRFYQSDAGDVLLQMAEDGEKVDVVFMDPPRTGSSEKFLSSLVVIKPKRIVYVSCDPETLARNLQYLCGKGYRMEKGCLVDMFPFTIHVETVVLMSRVEK